MSDVVDSSSTSPDFAFTSESLCYVVAHVSPGAAEEKERSVFRDYHDLRDHHSTLARAMHAAAQVYSTHVDGDSMLQWLRITRTLDVFQQSVSSSKLDKSEWVTSQLRAMKIGDVLAFPIFDRSAIVLTKQDTHTLFESLEVPLCTEDREKQETLMVRSYPSFAINIENSAFENVDFLLKLANFFRSPETVDPHYYTRSTTFLLSRLLSGIGHTIDVLPIAKRLRRVHWNDYHTRTHLWLVIRLVTQTCLPRSHGHESYKTFLLFFICTLAKDTNIATLSTDLLFSLGSKIMRRTSKLGSTSIPDWLSQMVLKACAGLREVLDARRAQLTRSPPPFLNPSQDELRRATRLALEKSQCYIQNALANHEHESDTTFHPNHYSRGTIDDFLSSSGASFFEQALRADPFVTLRDVEKAVEESVDDWVAHIVYVDDACAQVEILMDKYMKEYSEKTGIWLLTGIELFVAIDKLVLKEIPMLADYSPEIFVAALKHLLLYKKTNLHRLSCAYRYLSSRQSRSRMGWSVLSDEDGLPARYYDRYLHLSHLGATQSLLPAHAKVVIFERQCPTCIRIWRSAAARIGYYLCGFHNFEGVYKEDSDNGFYGRHSFRDDSAVSFSIQIKFIEDSPNSPTMLYAVQGAHTSYRSGPFLKIWQSRNFCYSPEVSYDLCKNFTLNISHTSNNVLADQAECSYEDFKSLDEFVAYGQLRSGGSLQWLNILHGLRTRTLNLRNHHVHDLLIHAVSEVGPLDLSNGKWVWHQELEDPTFRNSILDELENLFSGAIIDAELMRNISLFLTRVLEASPSESVSWERANTLLRRVRRKTFDWLHELSYNLGKNLTKEERWISLSDMSAACEMTFDVDAVSLQKLFQSKEDLGAALFLILLTGVGHSRSTRFSFSLERILSDLILNDVSDRAIDLVVCIYSPRHKPGIGRWEMVHFPNSCWFTCQIRETVDQPAQTVHFNLLKGEFRIEGEQVGNLERAIWGSESFFKSTFPARHFQSGLFVLQDMDSSTLPTTSQPKIQISLQNHEWMARVQRTNDSKDVLQWIPSNILEDDLPPALIHGHIHWLNLTTKTIEICALERPLEQSVENWRIDCGSGQYYAYKGPETLVDIGSPAWKMVSECFECLEVFSHDDEEYQYFDPKNLLITTFLIQSRDTSMLKLSVTLPHHGLSFFVNEWEELESHEFKHMVFDSSSEKQDVETLLGIHSLVLRQKSHLAEGLVFKRIIVPNGAPKMYGDRSYHRVRFEYRSWRGDSENKALYRIYDVDTEMGCLVGSGSVSSMRLLADMHSETSWLMPDPLTGKTGTQTFSSLVRSGACRSLKAIDAEKWHHHQYLQTDNLSPAWNTVTLDQLLLSRSTPKLPSRIVLRPDSVRKCSEDIPELDQLFPSLDTKYNATFQQDYITQLHVSRQHAQEDSYQTCKLEGEDRINTLTKHYSLCRTTYLNALESLKQSLGPTSDLEQARHQFGGWPAITGDSLLRCLASTSTTRFPDEWKKCLTQFALILLDLQRARRLLRFALDGLEEELSKELDNNVCDGWNPEQFPDWLLIQIQGNFLVRRIQAEIAMEMMSPKSRQNTVMQVNMGEGKSSVIIPIAAAALADGKQLARVIVPKALTAQMFEILVTRLGGLANRPIYLVPFSRSPGSRRSYEHDLELSELQEIMSECRAERGILLMQPQHAASLKLTCIEQQIQKYTSAANTSLNVHRPSHEFLTASMSFMTVVSKDGFVGNVFRRLPSQTTNRSSHAQEYEVVHSRTVLDASNQAVESQWLSLQTWMDSHVRDILDESDDILHPRFQMIYTFGPEQHIDGYPDRWTITQEVLQILRKCILTLARGYPNSIEIEYGILGSFPHVVIAPGSDIGLRMSKMVVEYVMDGRIPNLSFQDLSADLRDAIRSFISDKDVLQISDTAKKVEEYAKRFNQSCTWGALLLLRGLLASNILFFAIAERRWRVNYGLLPFSSSRGLTRSSMLAVPFRSKDMPAPNTHFGHPDITVIFTCLSYYYSGLSEHELRSSFEILLDLDSPHTEYARWIKDYDADSLPDSLRMLSDVNLRSSEQWDGVIFPLFTRNQAAIDFYLSRVVFPQELKEFPWKISASCWDLVGKGEKLITGFSGTNDNRWLLPMSIAQRDLDHQQGTTAKVLAYLLRPENNFYVTTHANGKKLTTPELLQKVALQTPEIRVLLDVGAQILDSSNEEVAGKWLDITRDAPGAVYFDNQDELMVLFRNGTSMPMLSSGLSHQLGRCVVYLDHVHTRGTDVKLPIGSRAAVTLGPKLTKDNLVQGCMRMRKLGRDHSVVFFAPPEVDLSIRALKGDPNSRITSADILSWSIHETWDDIQHWAPYWAMQGVDHKARQNAWIRFCKDGLTKGLSDTWLQPAIQSLEDLYTPREIKAAPSSTLMGSDPAIRQRCKDLGVLSLPSAQMDEEQEREVQRERERQREVELPPKAEQAEHCLHPDVTTFVETGITPAMYSSNAFQPIFTTLGNISVAPREADVWSPFILATTDFCTTIKPDSTSGTIDQYLRPIQWILSSERDPNILVVISPFEANLLLPTIRESEHVHLHLYAPRMSKRMKPTDDLQFYVIPPLPSDWTPPWALIDQLSVFSGQLYLRDYPSYLRLCRFLGVRTEESPDAAVSRWNVFDLFKNPAGRESLFSRSPLPFVMALLAIRTRGRPFGHTHMGKILYGQVLSEKDFDDACMANANKL